MKKKTKTILVFVIVVIIVLVSVLLFLDVFQTKYEKNDFIGTWYGESQISDLNPTATLITTFYENDSLRVEYHSLFFKDNRPMMECEADAINNTLTVIQLEQYHHYIWWGNWDLKNNKLSLTWQNQDGNYSPECSFKFENKNKMDLILDSINFGMEKTAETNFVLPQTHVKWEDVYIDTFIQNISEQLINVNLTRSTISLNLTNASYDSNIIYRDYAPAEWGNVTVGDVLQFPEDEARYFVSMMYRISIEPPASVGIGDNWVI